jgi:glycosyltransferase involved in cell wall biosynthesis
MSTLSLAMIVRNEGDTIERVLGSARSFCDEMIVVDTGSTDDTVAKARACGAQVFHFSWRDDFSAARNFSFSKCSGDWIIWLDGDDTVPAESQERISALKPSVLNDTLEAVYLRYRYPPFEQWRERIIRRNLFGTKLVWREPVHECIHGIDAGENARFDPIVIQHAPPPGRQEAKKDRNLAILRRSFEKGAKDDRTLYLYAVECLHNLLREEAESVLTAFFSTDRHPEYRYEILCKMFDFYVHFEEDERGVDALSKAIATDPARAEAYYKLGTHLSDRKDRPWESLPLLALAGMIRMPDHGTLETEAYSYGPWEALCRANFRIGRYKLAKAMADRALERGAPEREWLLALAQCDINCLAAPPLNPDWQTWVETNLARGVSRSHIVRILEENHFSPHTIMDAMDARQKATVMPS